MNESPGENLKPYLLEKKVTTADYYLPLMVIIVSVIIFLYLLPFAKVQLPAFFAFIPIYETALIFNDLITAVILFGQFAFLKNRKLTFLASGYLFTAFMAIAHMLTFPGLFSETGLLGANSQSTAWLYMFWHAGFPLFVIFYGLQKRAAVIHSVRFLIPLAFTFVFVTTLGFATLATAGVEMLPAIMTGNQYTPEMLVVVGSVWVFSLIALLILWLQKERTILDLWLMVTMSAWIFDIALSAVFNHGRYDVGFYSGRIYGFFASGFVLMALLIENLILYARLAKSYEQEKQNLAELVAVNEQLDAFTHSVSHDLRAPLRGIGTLAGILQEDYGNQLNADANNIISTLANGVKQMDSLIQGLLQFAYIGRRSLQTESFSVDELIKELLEELKHSYQSRKIEFKISPLGYIQGDRILLRQVFCNLLTNAIKYTTKKESALIEIGIQNENVPEKTFFIKDNGAGFDPQKVDRLFQVFHRLHSSKDFEGTGVGLSIVKRIVEKHGGKIWAEGAKDQGATFYVTLRTR